jgi:Skp family chaperone for outer membrane proteins
MKGAVMASETFKKRQKEMARKEKKMQKLARRLERKTEKSQGRSGLEEETRQLIQLAEHPGTTTA